MNPTQTELYQRIQAFTFDPPDAQLTFATKLAAENGWVALYSQRVIGEYKRWVFLVVVTGHSLSPSDAVDQVWHLHMLYSQSYWEEFCGQVLQRPLHHYPSRGGQAEKAKVQNQYLQTLADYQAYFGAAPPVDIWPLAQIRDTLNKRFVRVSLAENWVIPKFGWRNMVLRLTRDTQPEQVYRVYDHEVDMHMTQSHLSDTPHPTEKKLPNLDLYQTAYLAGGGERVALTAVVTLLQLGYLKHDSGHHVLLPAQQLAEHASTLEKAVVHQYAVSGATTLTTLEPKLKADTTRLRQSLEHLNLLQPQQGRKAWRIILSLTSFVGLLYWWPDLICLTLPVVLGLIALAIRSHPLPHTTYGKEMLATLHSRQTQATASDEASPGFEKLALQVALRGNSALNNTELAYLPLLIQPPPPPTDSLGCGC